MKLSRRQLRRLIETAIYEQAFAPIDHLDSKKQVVPKEVREELRKLRLHGMTGLAFDGDGNQGLAIRISRVIDQDGSNTKLAISRLKKLYGEDRVLQGVAKRLQGGSAGVKYFGSGPLPHGERLSDDKDELPERVLIHKDSIFIKMD